MALELPKPTKEECDATDCNNCSYMTCPIPNGECMTNCYTCKRWIAKRCPRCVEPNTLKRILGRISHKPCFR